MRKGIVVLVLMTVLFFCNILSLIVVAQDYENLIEDKDVIIKPGEKNSYDIDDFFDPGVIRVRISVDKSFSNGTLYYYVETTHDGLKEDGDVNKKVEFTFTYSKNDYGSWSLTIQNRDNVTIRYDLIMENIDNATNDEFFIHWILPIIVLMISVFVATVFIIYLKKKKFF